MGLIICPDCDHNISSEAPACPHCGKPMPPSQLVQRAAAEWHSKAVTALAVVVCIALFAPWLVYGFPPETGLLGMFWLILIASVVAIVLFVFGGLNAILNRKK